MLKKFKTPITSPLANLLNRLAGQPRALARNLKREVELPADMFAHPLAQTEWWYYTGHCVTEMGCRFGFEYVFFKRQTDHDKFGILPLRLLSNPMYAAHFAITDLDKKEFRFQQKRSFRYPFDPFASAAVDRYELTIGDWKIEGDQKKHDLRASINKNDEFVARLTARKPIALNGHADTPTISSKHFSYTRLEVNGRLGKNGDSEKFSGSAWMDREFGTWFQRNWDWFSIQFDDDCELMLYQFRDAYDTPIDKSHGTFVDRDGNCKLLSAGDFEISPNGKWTSRKTGISYPSGWKLRVNLLGIELEVKPYLKDQEIDARASTMIVYWEGACGVQGQRKGQNVSGNAYAELVGYDKRHMPGMLQFFKNCLRR